jgi:hypothetical protein
MRRLLIALGLLLAIGAATAQAQEKPFVLEAFGTFTVPTGDFADAVKASPGFGAALGYYVSPALLIGGSFHWAMMKAKDDAAFPLDEDILNFYAFFGYDVTAAQPSLALVPFLGVGATMFRFDVGGSTESETKFSANAGLKLYYWFSPGFGILAGAATNIIFMGSDELAPEASSTKILIPAQLGLVLGF